MKVRKTMNDVPAMQTTKVITHLMGVGFLTLCAAAASQNSAEKAETASAAAAHANPGPEAGAGEVPPAPVPAQDTNPKKLPPIDSLKVDAVPTMGEVEGSETDSKEEIAAEERASKPA